MTQQSLKVKIEGISPLMMHNGQLANPLNAFSKQIKAITSNRKKTEEHHIEISRLEFLAGLYVNSKRQVVIPSIAIESCITEGAKKSKLGKQFKSAIAVEHDSVLEYGKQLTPEQLWELGEEFVDVRSVKVGTARVMRTRPVFRTWSSEFEVLFDAEQVDEAQVVRAISDAGIQVGLLEYRPKFGRFQIA
jgi:hypothetical protein